MTDLDIARLRLHSQRLVGTPFEQPADVVKWLVAVQSQDYAGAKWALGLRARGAVEADVDRAFNDGAILRTHVLRPTWHFVLPEDIRWLLMLTAPRVQALNATYYRREGLDDATLKGSHSILANALQGGQQLTRAELAAKLRQAGIGVEGLRLGLIMMHAELEGIICSGARRGKQFTYALLDERAPHARVLDRDEALAELTLRFFTSRGPATPHDLSKWSGLTVADARAGLGMVKSDLVQATSGGKTYWLADSRPAAKEPSSAACWLPNYDEIISSYADLSAMFDPQVARKLDEVMYRTYPHAMLLDGQIVGLWRRVFETKAMRIEPHPFAPLAAPAADAFAAAAQRYGDFLGMPVVVA